MILPWMSPVTATPMAATSVTTAPRRVARRYMPDSSPTSLRRRCQSATAMTTPPPTMYAAVTTCGKVTSWTLLVSTATKSVSSARPLWGL